MLALEPLSQATRNRFFETVALLVLKPEALMARRSGAALRALYRQGFAVAAFERFIFSPDMASAFWRYSWNCATPGRLALVRELNALSPAFALWLVDNRRNGRPVPASVRLSCLKGAAYPEGRNPDSVRDATGALNPVLSFVHVSDEPADVLRESALILNGGALKDLVAYVTAAPTLELKAAIAHVEAIEQTTLCYPFNRPPDPAVLHGHYEARASSGHAEVIQTAFARLDQTNIKAKAELLAQLSVITPADLPGVRATINGDTYDLWRTADIADSG